MKISTMTAIAITCWAMAPVTVFAQASTPNPGDGRTPGLQFVDVFDGDLVSNGRHTRAALNTAGMRMGVRGVEFWFTPDTSNRPLLIGTDTVGMVPGMGPICGDRGCVEPGVYELVVGDNLRVAPEGWGRLRAHATGLNAQNVTDAEVHIFWHFQPFKAQITKPNFMDTVGPAGAIPVVAVTQASGLVAVKVIWQLIDLSGRNINPFEQHVDGPDVSPNGSASCVPTAIGANLAWLNDTTQWLTRSPVMNKMCGSGNFDRCLVAELGFLMGTTGGGTSGGGGDTGLVAYLSAIGYKKNVDYNLEHLYGNDMLSNVPQLLANRFNAGDNMISIGLHALPNEPGFGHFLALDNILMHNDGSAEVRLMDPFTVNNPPTTGIYRWFHLHKDGKLDWLAGAPAPGYYNPTSGQVRLDEMQMVSGFHFFNLGTNAAASASTVPTSGPVAGALKDHTWQGTFTPPAGSPGPWVLITEVTTETGHIDHDYQIVTRPTIVGQ